MKETSIDGFSILILRAALSGIFLVAGSSHILHPDNVLQRIDKAAFHEFGYFFGDPYTLGIVSGYAMIFFGLAFLFGIYTRWSAAILFAILIPITITIQMGNGLMHGPFWKNIALFGGLWFFIYNNPKSYTLFPKQ